MPKIKFLPLIVSLFVVHLCLAQNDTFSGSTSISAFEMLKDSIDFQEVAKLLNLELRSEENIKITDSKLDSILAIGERLRSNTGIGYIYDLKGLLYRANQNYDQSFDAHKESLRFFTKVKDSLGYRYAYKGMADISFLRGHYKKSITYGLEEIKYIKLTDSIALARWYNRLGIINETLKDFQKAETAFEQSIAYSAKVDISYSVLTSGNFARLYINKRMLSKAKEVLKEAVALSKTTRDRKYIYYIYNTLAEVYMSAGEFKQANLYIDSTYQITKNLGLEYDMYRAKATKAAIALQLRNYSETEKLLDECISFFKKVDSKSFLSYTYDLYFDLDSLQGDFQGSMRWMKENQKLSERLRIEDSAKELQNIEEEYKTELDKLQTIQRQEKEERQSNSKLFRFRIFLWVFIGALFVSLYLLYDIIKTRKQRKNLIQSLQNSNQIKTKLFSIISHDLKNEMHGLEASLRVIKGNHMTMDEFKQILPILIQRTNQTSILLNNLLNWSKSQMNELSAKPVNFDVNKLIAIKFDLFKPKADEKQISLINNLSFANVYADQDMVGIIAQNLIANAVKFCNSGDTITLSSKDVDRYVEIQFSDTGVGIPKENLNKLFAEDTYTTTGTRNESGTGLGLKICKELIELNQGSIHVDSKLGKGTTFSILLPKQKL